MHHPFVPALIGTEKCAGHFALLRYSYYLLLQVDRVYNMLLQQHAPSRQSPAGGSNSCGKGSSAGTDESMKSVKNDAMSITEHPELLEGLAKSPKEVRAIH